MSYFFLRARTALGAALALLVCAILAAGQTAPPSKEPAKKDDKTVEMPGPIPPAGMDASVAPPVDPKTFKIGAEDVIEIRVWKEPELSGQVVVRPDGMITANLVGELQVAGMTPDELRRKLTEEYSKVLNDPVVMVRMQQIRSSKYYITGYVGRTGMFPLVVPTTALEAITLAGGLTEYANRKKIIIQRKGKQFKFNYNDVSKGKNLSQNIYLENGDFIFVN